MKVLFFNLLSQIGGAERSLLTMLASFRAADPECRLNLMCASEGPLCDEARKLGVDVTILSLGARLSSIGDSAAKRNLLSKFTLIGRMLLAYPGYRRALKTIRQKLEQIAPDIIHSNNLKTHLMLGQCGYQAAPIVWHLHDFISDRPMIRRFLRRYSDTAARAVAVSEAVKKDWTSVLGEVPAGVLHNAVDTARFSPAAGSPELLDELAGLPAASQEEIVRVGLVATYATWKGHDVFIEAARLALPQLAACPVRFYIIGGAIYQTAGSQWTREQLTELVTRAGLEKYFGFVPFQTDTPSIYRALDIVVHASKQPEPFGLTIIEAMACGRAVIVSAAGGAAELIQNEVDALAVVPNDPASLARAIVRFASDASLRKHLGDAAVATVQMRFSTTRIGFSLLGIYRHLLKFRMPER